MSSSKVLNNLNIRKFPSLESYKSATIGEDDLNVVMGGKPLVQVTALPTPSVNWYGEVVQLIADDPQGRWRNGFFLCEFDGSIYYWTQVLTQENDGWWSKYTTNVSIDSGYKVLVLESSNSWSSYLSAAFYSNSELLIDINTDATGQTNTNHFSAKIRLDSTYSGEQTIYEATGIFANLKAYIVVENSDFYQVVFKKTDDTAIVDSTTSAFVAFSVFGLTNAPNWVTYLQPMVELSSTQVATLIPETSSGATYTAGNGISINANNEISVTAPTLVNTATGQYALGVGSDSYSTGAFSVAVGQNTSAEGYGIAIGYNSRTNQTGSLAIGYFSRADGMFSIQLNGSYNMASNNDANTFKVANGNGNFEIMSADGTIPADRLTHAINKYSTMPTASADNLGWIVQFTGTTDATYTHGYIYECVSDGGNPATYSWTQTSVQPAPSGLPDQTGQSGKFLTTDGTDASWSDKPIINNINNVNGGISILGSSSATGQNSILIGANAGPYSNSDTNCIVVGATSKAATNSIAMGNRANADANACVQINLTSSSVHNTDANTFKVANANGNYEIMSADGTVPTARLTKVNTTATLAAADWSSSTQTVSITGMTADGVVMVSPTPANQTAYTSAGILCTAQAAGSLTFTCDTVPSADIIVTVVML